MTIYVYGTQLTGDSVQHWLSVKSFVLGQTGIKEKLVGTSENFISLANKLYDLSVPTTGDFVANLAELHAAIHGLSKSARRKRRCANIGKLGYEVRPMAAGLRRAAKKAKVARKLSARAEQKREEYRKQHLVLVAKDGAPVFGNVKQHASREKREEFYRSWEWRKLRMEVMKRYARRCMCCGAQPGDETVAGTSVRLVVDHIKPISKYWHLRLAPQNLQILCDECNMGKGAWDETDYRSDAERMIAEQLQYVVA